MKKELFISKGFAILFLSAFIIKGYGQAAHQLEPAAKYYKTLGALSITSNSSRSWMDTIQYPWLEYSQNAINYSLYRTIYLNPNDEAKLPGLIAMPSNGSDQTKAELEYLMSLQNSRTKEQIERAQNIAGIGSWFHILNPIDSNYNKNRSNLYYIAEEVGSWYNHKDFPATTKLLLNCIQDIRVTEFRLKWHFKRPRPYHLEPMLQPLTRIKTPAFPSGHTLWAYTQAYIFSEIIPEKRNDFLQKADEVRWSRELLGIHFPSDNEAARIIGWYLLKYWYNNPAFVTDLEAARAEWTAGKR